MQTQRTLRLTESQYATIVGSCYDGLPDEACGLFIGPLALDGHSMGALSEAIPCRNADASARTYTVDPRDMLAAGRRAETRGEEIVGVWHSHTHTDAYPSPTDVRQAVDPLWWYVIVSLRDDAPVLRAYQIVDRSVVEHAVELGRG